MQQQDLRIKLRTALLAICFVTVRWQINILKKTKRTDRTEVMLWGSTGTETAVKPFLKGGRIRNKGRFRHNIVWVNFTQHKIFKCLIIPSNLNQSKHNQYHTSQISLCKLYIKIMSFLVAYFYATFISGCFTESNNKISATIFNSCLWKAVRLQ